MARRTVLTISTLLATATMGAAPALAAEPTPVPTGESIAATIAATTVAAPVTTAAPATTASPSSTEAATTPATATTAAPPPSTGVATSVVSGPSTSVAAAAADATTAAPSLSGPPTSTPGNGASSVAHHTSSSVATSVAPGSSSTTIAKVAAAAVSTTTTTSIDPTAVVPKGVFEAPKEGWPVRSIVFPTLGPSNYYDGWGDYRGDIATHFHIGVDILGSKLQPLVAATNGTISHIVQNHVTAGWGLVITDDEGWDYRYYHMNNDAPGTDDASNPITWRFAPGITEGSRVVAGQLIGYMGDSGDSEATTHTHFEIHRPDGSPINPYPSVRAADKPTRCAPPKGLGDLPNFVPPTDTDADIVNVDAFTGIGSFTLSANGTVFRVGSARQVGDPRFVATDGPCDIAP